MALKPREFKKGFWLAGFALLSFVAGVYAQNSKQDGALNQWIVYAQRGDYDEAIAELTQIIKTHPDSADAHYDRGTIYAQEGKFDEAINDCNKAIELKPDYADAYYNRAVAYFSKKQ